MALSTMSRDLRSAVVSAPGKAILLGEYSLSWGRTGVAAALDKRMFAKVEEAGNLTLELYLPDIKFSKRWSLDSVLDKETTEISSNEVNKPLLDSLRPLVDGNSTATSAALTFLYLFRGIYAKRRHHGLKVSISSELPVGAGLGSSAAYSVCLSAGMYCLTQEFLPPQGSICKRPGDKHVPLDVKELLVLNTDRLDGSNFCCCDCPHESLALVNKWALIGEKIIHGITSGIDNAVSTFGGIISYKKGEISVLSEFPTFNVLLVDTRVQHSTRALGLAVKERLQRFPRLFGHILDAAEETCLNMIQIASGKQEEIEGKAEVSKSFIENMGELLDIGHHLVLCMGPVDHSRLQEACEIQRKKGMHCKLTGAGGGGSTIALIPPSMSDGDLKAMKDELVYNKFDVWESRLGCCGMIIHSLTFPSIS